MQEVAKNISDIKKSYLPWNVIHVSKLWLDLIGKTPDYLPKTTSAHVHVYLTFELCLNSAKEMLTVVSGSENHESDQFC